MHQTRHQNHQKPGDIFPSGNQPIVHILVNVSVKPIVHNDIPSPVKPRIRSARPPILQTGNDNLLSVCPPVTHLIKQPISETQQFGEGILPGMQHAIEQQKRSQHPSWNAGEALQRDFGPGVLPPSEILEIRYEDVLANSAAEEYLAEDLQHAFCDVRPSDFFRPGIFVSVDESRSEHEVNEFRERLLDDPPLRMRLVGEDFRCAASDESVHFHEHPRLKTQFYCEFRFGRFDLHLPTERKL